MPLPSPANLEIAQAGLPVGIHPATPPRLDDSHSDTRQVKGSNGHNQQKTLQGFGSGECICLELESTRFLIEEGFFNVETQAVLVQRLRIGWFITGHEPGIICLVNGTYHRQMERPNSCSEKCHLLEEMLVSSRGTQIPNRRGMPGIQMDQGVASQS